MTKLTRLLATCLLVVSISVIAFADGDGGATQTPPSPVPPPSTSQTAEGNADSASASASEPAPDSELDIVSAEETLDELASGLNFLSRTGRSQVVNRLSLCAFLGV